MGVPGFFKWLLDIEKKNKNLIRCGINKKIKYLMLDANCLLHPCVNHVIQKIKSNNVNNKHNYSRVKVEEEIWELITNRIDEMINTLQPEILYIAIDGVVPISKILQQRQRRHKYYYDNDIASKNEICNNIYPISSIELTPGTDYMERIHLKMIEYLKKKNVKYIYSSYHEEGEGEHKILKYIKTNIKDNDAIVIYGLDADLLFLALSAMVAAKDTCGGGGGGVGCGVGCGGGGGGGGAIDVYIMREKPVFQNKEVDLDDSNATEYNYVEIKELYNVISNTTINMPVPDFIVICYLIGNDFMPHLLTITFKKKGLDKLINAYDNVIKKIGKDKTIVEKNKDGMFVINYDFLHELFIEIQYTERNIWKNINRPYRPYRHTELNGSTGPKGHTETNGSNGPYRHTELNGSTGPKGHTETKGPMGSNGHIGSNGHAGPAGPMVNTITEDKIEFKDENEYYNHYLGINELKINKNTKKYIVLKYIEGIEWCMNYYLNNRNSWSWGYSYPIAPLIQDIITYFPYIGANACKDGDVKKGKDGGYDGRLLCPMEQLILAIPRETYKYVLSTELIDKLRENKIIGYMFPLSYSIDINKDDLYWKCPVSIPTVDYDEYIREIKKIDILKTAKNNLNINELNTFNNL
jgi:5'-3' exonuclease